MLKKDKERNELEVMNSSMQSLRRKEEELFKYCAACDYCQKSNKVKPISQVIF